jgi:hypothetical protein
MTSTPALSKKGNTTVSKLTLNKKSAVIALAATAVLAGGVAFAYPNGVPLTVAATAAPSNDPAHLGQTAVIVTVSDANPTCATRIRVDGGNEEVLPAGTTTTTIFITPSPGRHSVRARTLDCAKGQKEHADSKFVILDAQASGPATATVKKNYQVKLAGFEPETDITVTATLPGTNPLVQVQDTDTADRRGNAKVKFKFTQPGTWVITSVGGSGSAAPFQVIVSAT